MSETHSAWISAQHASRLLTARHDDIKQVDGAIVKYFGVGDSRFHVRRDVLNVLNEQNFAQFHGDGCSVDFGAVGNSGSGGNLPRTFKLSVDLNFYAGDTR